MISDDDLTRISAFHGHLGPFVVIGYRMGEAANRLLGPDAFKKTAVALMGGKTPRSCVIDGVQLSSGCTLGKGTISVVDHGQVACVFFSKSDDRSCKITLRPDVLEKISNMHHEDMETIARSLSNLPDKDLFDIVPED